MHLVRLLNGFGGVVVFSVPTWVLVYCVIGFFVTCFVLWWIVVCVAPPIVHFFRQRSRSISKERLPNFGSIILIRLSPRCNIIRNTKSMIHVLLNNGSIWISRDHFIPNIIPRWHETTLVMFRTCVKLSVRLKDILHQFFGYRCSYVHCCDCTKAWWIWPYLQASQNPPPWHNMFSTLRLLYAVGLGHYQNWKHLSKVLSQFPHSEQTLKRRSLSCKYFVPDVSLTSFWKPKDWFSTTEMLLDFSSDDRPNTVALERFVFVAYSGMVC